MSSKSIDIEKIKLLLENEAFTSDLIEQSTGGWQRNDWQYKSRGNECRRFRPPNSFYIIKIMRWHKYFIITKQGNHRL